MIITRRCFRSSYVSACACVATLILLAACSEPSFEVTHDGEAADVSMGLPSVIAQARAVDPAALDLEVSIGNQPVSMSRVEGATRWTGTLNVAPGQYNVRARWFETIADQSERLVLGTTEDLVSMVGSRPVRFTINAQNFDTSFDIDQDGWFNLHEREIDTNPFDVNSPESPPVFTTLNLSLDLPVALQLDAIDGGNLTAIAFVNGLGVPLDRQGNQWLGSATVGRDARAFIRVDWYQDSSRQLLLGRSQQAFNATENSVYTPAADSYRWDYDQNSNGVSNLNEALGN